MNHGGLTRAHSSGWGQEEAQCIASRGIGVCRRPVRHRCRPCRPHAACHPARRDRRGREQGDAAPRRPVSPGSQVHLVGRDLGRRDPGRRPRGQSGGREGSHQPPRNVQGLLRRSPAATRQVEGHHAKQRTAHRERVSRGCLGLQWTARGRGCLAPRRRVRWTPGEGSSGSAVRLEGARFPPQRRVRIRFGGVSVGSARTGRRGRFSMRLTVPALGAGRRLVRVKLRSRALGFMFTITGAGAGGRTGPQEEVPARRPASHPTARPAAPVCR